MFEVWAVIDSSPDRSEIRKTLINNPSLTEQVLELNNIATQIGVLLKVLNKKDGPILFSFLKGQKLLEKNIPEDDLQNVILNSSLSEVVPALQLLSSYCGLLKDFN